MAKSSFEPAGKSPTAPGFDSSVGVRRRPWAMAASALVVVVSAAVTATAFSAAGHKVTVLAVARRVAAGGKIVSGDLREVKMSPASGVQLVPASEIRSVSGRHAAVELSPGMLLSPRDLGSEPNLAGGEAMVGLALKDGQLPASGIATGDWVDVVLTDPAGQALPTQTSSGAGTAGMSLAAPAAGNSAPSIFGGSQSGTSPQSLQTDPSKLLTSAPGTILVRDALVESVAPPPPSTTAYREEVSLRVPASIAGALSAAATAGQASVFLVSSPPGS